MEYVSRVRYGSWTLVQGLILASPEKLLDPLPEEAKVFPWVTHIAWPCPENAPSGD